MLSNKKKPEIHIDTLYEYSKAIKYNSNEDGSRCLSTLTWGKNNLLIPLMITGVEMTEIEIIDCIRSLKNNTWPGEDKSCWLSCLDP
jgi:hypothetical protein